MLQVQLEADGCGITREVDGESGLWLMIHWDINLGVVSLSNALQLVAVSHCYSTVHFVHCFSVICRE